MIVLPGKKDNTSKINISMLSNCIFSHESLVKILSGEADMHVLERLTVPDSISSAFIKPDIIIICQASLDNDSIRKIIKKFTHIKILICNFDHAKEKEIISLLRYGVMGIIYKEDSYSTLIEAIRKIYRGEIWVERRVLQKALKEEYKIDKEINAHMERLTEIFTGREIEIVDLITRGQKNKSIATRLYISEQTVKFHISRIFKKLNCTSRHEVSVRVFEIISR